MSIHALITKVPIKADAQGNAPTSIELLRVGDWHTPWHGDFEITMADLHEFAANFAKGIGLVEADKRAPINYAHESWEKAAGWMTSLSVDETRQALVASVEWTPAGEQAVKDKEWSYISPEFNPRGYPWEDSEGSEDADGIPTFVANVLTGAAVTNIPLFKKLKPIMASRVPSKSKKADVTSGDGNKINPEGVSMNIEEIRKKQVADLTDEEKTFLSEHKADLTDDERTTFGLVDDADAKAQADKEAADKAAAEQAEKEKADADAKAAEEAEKIEASRKGNVSISASELAGLKASAARADALAAEIDRNKATAIVTASVKAGQVKSGDKDSWVDLLTGLKADQRNKAEKLLASLPVNETLGKELGGAGVEVSTDATEELNNKVAQKIKASAAEGTTVGYYEARTEILAADSGLAARVKEETEN